MKAESESIFDICRKVYQEILEMGKDKDHDHDNGQTIVLSTGFKDIDRKISGFHPGELIILGARPCMGKTAFALNILEHVCIVQKKKALVFTMQESKEAFVKRLIALHSGVDLLPAKSSKLTDAQYKRLGDSAECIGSSGLTVFDLQPGDLDTIRSVCFRKKAEEGLDLVIVDNLQLLKDFNICYNGHRMVNRDLKTLAEELACPILAMSQISRKVEGRDDKRPRPVDLLGFKKVKHDADLVMLLYRDKYYHSDNPVFIWEEAEISIFNRQNGDYAVVWLKMDESSLRFYDSYRHEEMETIDPV